MQNIRFFLFSTIIVLCVFSGNAQKKTYELSEFCDGVGMNAILNHINTYDKQEKKEADNTLEYYQVKDTHFTFLNSPITNLKILLKNKMVERIVFTLEEKEITAPELSYDLIASSNKNKTENELINHRKKVFLQFLKQHSIITQKTKEYLNTTYQFISEEPLCQFDCMAQWQSKYAEIFIEKNNFMEDDPDDLSTTKVYIDQTLIIQSTLMD